MYDADGIFGNTYYGRGCDTPTPFECGFSYGFTWNCLDALGNSANCANQTLTVTFTPFSGGVGGCGCPPGKPLRAQLAEMTLTTDNLPWHTNGTPGCFNANDCMPWNDSRLNYSGTGGGPVAMVDLGVPIPQGVATVPSSQLACLIGADVGKASPLCHDVNDHLVPLVQNAVLTIVNYTPNPYGWRFDNVGVGTAPTYAAMAGYYPNSVRAIYYQPLAPIGPSFPTLVGRQFYDRLWVPAFTGGLCYGMATSSVSSFYSSARTLYSVALDRTQPVSGAPFGTDPTPLALIERFHARQYGLAGAAAAVGAWMQYPNTIDNVTAFGDIERITKTRPVVVGIGPKHGLSLSRFQDLFNVSHEVVAYATISNFNLATRVIEVYDPNAPGDNSAHIDVDASGRIKLTSGGRVTYGGGGNLGSADELTLGPVPDSAFGSAGNDNWLVDAGYGFATIAGLPSFIWGAPLFTFTGPGGQAAMQMPAATPYSSLITAGQTGAGLQAGIGNRVLGENEVSPTPGDTHMVAVPADDSSITVSLPSRAQTFNLTLGADLPSGSRQLDLSGVTLSPTGTMSLAADPAVGSFVLTTSGATSTRVPAILAVTTASGPASVSLSALVPAAGSATIQAFDWNAVSTTLILESITTSGGVTTDFVLKANPSAQRQLEANLLSDLRSSLATATQNERLLAALQGLVDLASAALDAGRPNLARLALKALSRLIADQLGEGITAPVAKDLQRKIDVLVALITAK